MADDDSIDDGRQAILAALERHQVLYVVIGGAAAQARGWPEPTDDIDVTPERSEGNLTRLATAVEELDAGFRVDPARYPEGYRPPDGIDARTFRSQVSITFTTRHGDFDVVLVPDGTSGYEEIIATATPETVPGTGNEDCCYIAAGPSTCSGESTAHIETSPGRPGLVVLRLVSALLG